MVATLAGKALPEPLREQILTRTDGVPLFVEELTKSVLESGELKEAGDHYEYAGSARAVTIPATLAGLADGAAGSLRAGEGDCPDRRGDWPRVQLRADRRGGADAAGPTDDALARLCESGLAFRRGTPPDAIYTFKHALVQDAAYDSLLKSRRQELHGKIARVIEAALPEHQDHRTRGAGASPHGRGPCRGRHSALAGRRRAGIEAHGPDRGHRPSQPGARTGLHPASVIGTRRQRTGAAHPPWPDGFQRIRHYGLLGNRAARKQAGPLPPTPRRSATAVAGAGHAGRPARSLRGPDRSVLFASARSACSASCSTSVSYLPRSAASSGLLSRHVMTNRAGKPPTNVARCELPFYRLGPGRGRARASVCPDVWWLPPGPPQSANSSLAAPDPLCKCPHHHPGYHLAGRFAVGSRGRPLNNPHSSCWRPAAQFNALLSAIPAPVRWKRPCRCRGLRKERYPMHAGLVNGMPYCTQ